MTEPARQACLRASKPLSALMIAALLAALAVQKSPAATLVVNNTSASGPGSLQQAILDADSTNGLDKIIFQIPGSGVHTISPANALPAVTDPVVIDGTTQPGYAGTPLIEINGANAGSSVGLRVFAGNCTIRGLAINRFAGQGLLLQGGGSNQVQATFIGTDPAGTIARGNGLQGIWINVSSSNLIGGTDATNRNVISGNGDAGVYLVNSASNIFQGNLIGTTVSGAAALGNGDNGIYLNNGQGNLIGGTAPGARNVISANSGSGVYLDGSGTTGTLVQGNTIGTDLTGTTALRNAADGVTINKAPGNTVGGAVAGAGNVISGNSQGGVNLIGPGADSNLIQGNLIGTGASGRLALGNLFSGITLLAANSNLIGGTTAAARNLVSANKHVGIYIGTNSVGNAVQGNYIGMDATGTNILGNALNGLSIDSARSNTVGGTISGAGNVISGNANHGIEIYNAGATGNAIQGNTIGTEVQGSLARANKLWGIHILSAGNTVGGADSAGNLISGNLQGGIFLDAASAANNVIQGNRIGTTADGTGGLGNGGAGIGITSAPGNTIGGTGDGAGNLISANGDAGIFLYLSGATGNLIQGNTIGTDITGNQALGNTYEGIYIERAPTNTIGGAATGAGNLISGGNTRGIWLTNASWNIVQGNLIGTRSDGVTALGNQFHGVECEVGACNNTIGGAGSAGNTMAFAQSVYAGVRVRDGSTNNAIVGNSIFSNGALGIDLGNAGANPNVACDTSGGANMGQNYPVLTQAVSGRGTGIRGVLNSRRNATFLLQFFANATGDPSGYGEGQIYLGQQTVTTSATCTNSFVASLAAQVPVGYVITATATDSANNTSEFSAGVPVVSAPVLAIKPQPASYQIALSWTNTPTGFVLKATSSLTPPILWATVTNTPVLTNGQFVVTLPVGVPVPSVPVLAIKPQPASHQISLAWTNTATGFVLEQTSSLCPPIQWTVVTNAPVLVNGQFVVTLPAATENQFYALCFPATVNRFYMLSLQ